MANYNNYIELSPHYESVVDIDSESRNPELWKEYIIHEDMQAIIEKICESLKYEDPDKRRSFWLHGAYGTGKSYAALVLKHLFEDNIESIRKFLSNQMLIKYRDRFLSIREKGEFLVIWKSQTTDIKGGMQLMMAMEAAICERLKEKYGEKAYYGRKSLISATKDAINDHSINWEDIFNNQSYGLYEEYGSCQEFQDEVNAGNLKAANIVARIYRDKGWGLFNSLETFKDWVADIIEGNHLQETGIIFIWDEFTSYLRDNPTDDTLQPLSEFCKKQPFFMFLIVHKTTSWINQMGSDVYERVIHRYHSLEFRISETAAYELIGSSILTKPGMEDQWNAVRDRLMNSISNNIADFDNLSMSTSTREQLRQLCPLHPMTLSLLTIVAQYFGASQRTLFRFMKDVKESDEKVGFIYYINNFGPDGWQWLTPDFLWDYFFTRESDVRTFSDEAKDAYRHYVNKSELISGDYHLRVFKAAMLLIATTPRTTNNLFSHATQTKIQDTESTLCKCFAGQLTKDDVKKYLEDLVKIEVLHLDNMRNGDKRLQIPYSGKSDGFEERKKAFKESHNRYHLFSKTGAFAKSIEEKIWDKNKASFNRMAIAACNEDAKSCETRYKEIEDELDKNRYKFGILVVTISESNKFVPMGNSVKALAARDKTGRLAVYLLKSPLTEEHLDRWYTAMTHSELAKEEGKAGDSERYREDADAIIEEWAASAMDDQFDAVYGEKTYQAQFSVSSFASKLEKEVILGTVFSAAPEKIVTTSTAFKKNQERAALSGIKKTYEDSQILNIVNGLKEAGAWEEDSLEAISKLRGKDSALAIAHIADFIRKNFSEGAQIKLDNLWSTLQEPPYGYYNCMACGYILGFLLRQYVNSDFTWNKGDNNPWHLTEQNLATMITSLCSGKVVNNYLSSGSEAWRKFKPYAQSIFHLTPEQATNEIEARKHMGAQCVNVGVPFWGLKYVPEEKFGGVDAKQSADVIIDLFWDFISERGNQEQAMANVFDKFKGHGSIKNTLSSLYFDKNTIYEAFRTFVSQECGEIQQLQESIGLSSADILDAVHKMMQGLITSWTEEQVEAKLPELLLEYQVLAILNDALDTNRRTIKAISDDIANAFNNMKVPGSVIEKLGYPWTCALQAMRVMSKTQWSTINLEDRERYANLLKTDAPTVWRYVSSSKPLLEKYLETYGQNCSVEELDDIYNALKPVNYDSLPADFATRIGEQLGKVEYNRNKARIQELWKTQSGFDSISQWCDSRAVPIQWVVDDKALTHIETLKAVQDGKRVDSIALHNATQFFESSVNSELKDKALIDDRFFAQIGESYRNAFKSSGNILIAQLKTNAALTSDVYSWSNKVGEIKRTIDRFLRDKYCNEAKKNVQSMAENQLRAKVVQLLDQNPDLYALFLK